MLVDQFQADLKQAILNKHELKRDTLRLVLSAARKKAMDLDQEVDDELLMSVLLSERKTRQQSMEQFRLGGREDLVSQAEAEIELINAYLPKQLSEEEMIAAVKQAIATAGATSPQEMGKVMGQLSSLKGKADMKRLSSLVKAQLGGA